MKLTFAYARLVRLPNVFTALADVSIGLIVGRDAVTWHQVVALLGCSASLYCAGMAWNDFFDRHIDAVERPARPIPSGAIRASSAWRVGIGLAGLALLLAMLAGRGGANWQPQPGIHAVVLLGLILAYDAGLKSSLAGPSLMGSCRLVNVLLGFSTLPDEVVPWVTRLAPAVIVGVYVAGITCFSRDEAGISKKSRLLSGIAISLGALATATLIGGQGPGRSILVYGLALVILYLLVRGLAALRKPTAVQVQRYVKSAILAIIVIDASLATGLTGPHGLMILLWLIPALGLGRWLYST